MKIGKYRWEALCKLFKITLNSINKKVSNFPQIEINQITTSYYKHILKFLGTDNFLLIKFFTRKLIEILKSLATLN